VIIQNKYQNKHFRYDGTVKNITSTYINKAMKGYGKEKRLYVSFIDENAYHVLLTKGSLIMCYINNTLFNCTIVNLVRDNSNNIAIMEVSIDDDENISLFPIIFKTAFNNIVAMLITEQAYSISKL